MSFKWTLLLKVHDPLFKIIEAKIQDTCFHFFSFWILETNMALISRSGQHPVIRLQYFHSETGVFAPSGASWVYKGQHLIIRHFSISLGRFAHVLWVSRYHVLVIIPADKAGLSLWALCVAQTWIRQNLRRKLWGMTPTAQLLHHRRLLGHPLGFLAAKAQAVPLPQPMCSLPATMVGRLGCVLGSGSEGLLEAGSVCAQWDPIAARSALSPSLRGV